MAKTDVPKGRSDRMSGQESVTLMNEVVATTKGTTPSAALFGRKWDRPELASEDPVVSFDRNEFAAPAISVFETAAVIVGFIAVVLTAILFFFQLSS